MEDYLEDTSTGQVELKWSWSDEETHNNSKHVWVGTWDFLKKEGKSYRQIKFCGPKRDDLNSLIEFNARCELNNNLDDFPTVVRDFVSVDKWKSKETIPTGKINSRIEREFNVNKGDNITLYDEGKFRVYDVLDDGIYSENPWLKLISLEKNYVIAMSLKTIRQKLNIKDHKRLNYPIISNVDNMASYWRTVGHLLKHKATLRIRTTPKTHEQVIKSYELLTNQKISDEVKNKYVDYNPNMDTFIDNAHLYFPVVSKEIRGSLCFPPNKKGKQEGDVNNNKIEKIHNTEFVWTLFSYGFRLGGNHDSDMICKHVEINAEEFIEAFEEGNDEWLI